MQQFTKKVTIQNHAGIHCRPSAAIMQLVNSLKPVIFSIKIANQSFPLNSLLVLIGCGLKEGDIVEVTARGDNAQAACEQVANLFEFNFDYPPQN